MQNLRDRRRVYPSVLSIALLASFFAYSESRFVPRAAAAPTTFIVFNTNDGGAGSLRQAILSANANPGFGYDQLHPPAGRR